MDAPIYATVVTKLFSLIDQVLQNYTHHGYSILANHLRYPLGLAIILHLSITGIAITQGWVILSLGHFIKSAIKISLIYTLALHWDVFSYYGVQGIESSAGQIGNWLVHASPIPLPEVTGGMNEALQLLVTEITKLGTWTWGLGSIRNWGPFFTAMVIWMSGMTTLGIVIAEIALAKIMLALLFTTAPLFISFTLFKPTQTMFDHWLGAICGFALFLIFIPAATVLVLNLMHWTIGISCTMHKPIGSLVGFVPLLIVSMLGKNLIIQVTHYAKHIGGTISTSASSTLLASTIGGIISNRSLTNQGLIAQQNPFSTPAFPSSSTRPTATPPQHTTYQNNAHLESEQSK